VIDGYVVPAHPASLFESRKANDLPLLLGFNADEGSLFAARSTPPADANAYENLLRSVFKDQAAQALALYPAGENGSSIKPSFTALTGDQIISYGTWAWADKVSRLYQSPVYRYYFNRRPPAAPENSLYPLTGAGVYHFADVLYAFNNLWLRPDWGWQAADHQLAQTMANYWVNFAKTGNPNGPGLPEWPRFTARHQQVMELGAHIGPVSQPNAARYEFLNQFYNHQR
jgi:para-nitrobenzyl esterase